MDFLYDGVNPVQEQPGGGQTTDLLTGLGVDEYFVRTDQLWSQHFLPDGLGSTIALTDGTGTVAKEYPYEFFGETTEASAATTTGTMTSSAGGRWSKRFSAPPVPLP